MTAENGARIPIVLHDKEGKQYDFQFTPFTDRSHSEMDEWLGQRMILMASRAVRFEPQHIKAPAIAAACEAAATVSWLSGAGLEMIKTVSGMSRIVWQGIHSEHPDIDQAWILANLFFPASDHTTENTNRVSRLLNHIHHGTELKAKEVDSPDPT